VSIEHQLDWQWLAHAWSKQDSPATALRHYLSGSDEATVVEWLCFGAADPDQLRAELRTSVGGLVALLELVVTAAPVERADLVAAADHLRWQAFNDPLSLRLAMAALDSCEIASRVGFGYHVASGQSHNAAACQVYRACMREKYEAFVGLVRRAIDEPTPGRAVITAAAAGQFRDRV
jgi:hypothetical protein